MEELTGMIGPLAEIIWLNVILSGDNAVVIGLAAAGLPPQQRARAVLFGVIAAAVLRIVFSIFATLLLALWWVDLVGGLALLYIAWSFLRELRHGGGDAAEASEAAQEKSLLQALWQIILADVSMSLDNVLAVAGGGARQPDAAGGGPRHFHRHDGPGGRAAGEAAGSLQDHRLCGRGADCLYRLGIAVGGPDHGEHDIAARPGAAGGGALRGGGIGLWLALGAGGLLAACAQDPAQQAATAAAAQAALRPSLDATLARLPEQAGGFARGMTTDMEASQPGQGRAVDYATLARPRGGGAGRHRLGAGL
ncbi:YjbE family putative metal transport protein [Teichococcus cervicalis]